MKTNKTDFDVIIVGGGHAGIEAAYAAARMGSKTLLITLDIQKIGWMPCNPAIGGIGKGHIVFEISALGGLMPQLCTKTYLQARMLNTKKGPAVQGLRLQIDKEAYNQLSINTLSKTHNLTLVQGAVSDVLVYKNRISGLTLQDGRTFSSKATVITTGTFLNGRIFIGLEQFSAGRQGEKAVTHLSRQLALLGLQMGRLKTGTPPRLLKSSIDFSKLIKQMPDNLAYLFEFSPHQTINTRDCYITHTNHKTHEIIRNNLHLSPMYNGVITGKPPRYCPSIEDKIARFPDKDEHQIFVEPESASTEEVYPNGISTSLPLSVQEQYIRTIHGFEEAIITKAGYAVEYDFVLPHQLHQTLETKHIQGLFLAGQINGTTGYEEAAGQGIIAGINAHLKAHKLPPFIFSRDEGYIGVMINDLVTLGVDEPYRMFTSRAENRLSLRQDNAFHRLAEQSHHLGLIDEHLYQAIKHEKHIINETISALRKGHNSEDILQLLGRDERNINRLHELTGHTFNDRAILALWAEIRYEPYLKREQREREKAKKYQNLTIPTSFNTQNLPGLSKELQEKIRSYKPQNIAQAALIPGMTPAALSLLAFKIHEHQRMNAT